MHMGLTVTLNTQVEESYCTGFRGLLHVPVSQPEMVEYGFAISPGDEIIIFKYVVVYAFTSFRH